MVDAKHIIQHLDEEKPEGAENEAVEQLVSTHSHKQPAVACDARGLFSDRCFACA